MPRDYKTRVRDQIENLKKGFTPRRILVYKRAPGDDGNFAKNRPWRCGPVPEDWRESCWETHDDAIRWATDREYRIEYLSWNFEGGA